MEKCPHTGLPCDLHKQVHITDLKDGVVQESHCCHQCAEQFIEHGPQEVKTKEDPGLKEAAFDLTPFRFQLQT